MDYSSSTYKYYMWYDTADQWDNFSQATNCRYDTGTSRHRSGLLSALRTSKVHSGHDAVILVWHRTCIWLQYIIVIELSKVCADNLNDLGVMKDFLISLWHAAHYTTGWLIDHVWKSNKQITIVSWPNKLHHKKDFYIFYQGCIYPSLIVFNK